MTSSIELAATWNNALVELLPRVIVHLTLEFLRVDHVVRVVPCEELWSPDLARVRRWLFVNLVPIEVLFHWRRAAWDKREAHEDLFEFFRNCLADYIGCIVTDSLPPGSCFKILHQPLVSHLDDACREEIWRSMELVLAQFAGPNPCHAGAADWPKARWFLSQLVSKGSSIAFDGETGECFSCDRNSVPSRLFETDVLVAAEQAWKCPQGSFRLRDNVLAIVDIGDEEGTTRVAFDYPASEHPQH